jgi:hypothetical protein
MKPARPLALILAISVAAVASFAQEATSPQSITRSRSTVSRFSALQDETASLAATPASSAEAPDALLEASTTLMVAPVSQPQVVPEHKFWDRQQKLALAAHSAVRLADTIKTCRELAHGGVEDWIPTQSCGGVAAWNAGSVGVALGIGWLFHKYGFHRLERITPWLGTGASAAGLTKSVFNIR